MSDGKTAEEPDPEPEGVAITGGGVWVPHAHAGTVVRNDPDTYQVTSNIKVAAPGQAGPQSAATNGLSLWVSVPRDGSLVRIDPATGEVAGHVDLEANGAGSGPMAAEERAVWMTNGPDSVAANLVFRVNAVTDTKEAAIYVGGAAVDVAIGFGAVWVVTESPAALVRIDP